MSAEVSLCAIVGWMALFLADQTLEVRPGIVRGTMSSPHWCYSMDLHAPMAIGRTPSINTLAQNVDRALAWSQNEGLG